MAAETTLDERGPGPSGGLPGMRALLRRSPWIALAATLGLTAGVGLDQIRSPVYESTAYLAVTSVTSQDAGSMARSAQALARLATSLSIVSDPLREAGLADAAADPARFIRVQAAPDAPIVSVTGMSTDAATAQRTAEVVSRTLTGLDAVDPFEAALVGFPPIPEDPTAPSWLAPAGGAGIAGVLAVALAATLPEERRTPTSAGRERGRTFLRALRAPRGRRSNA